MELVGWKLLWAHFFQSSPWFPDPTADKLHHCSIFVLLQVTDWTIFISELETASTLLIKVHLTPVHFSSVIIRLMLLEMGKLDHSPVLVVSMEDLFQWTFLQPRQNTLLYVRWRSMDLVRLCFYSLRKRNSHFGLLVTKITNTSLAKSFDAALLQPNDPIPFIWTVLSFVHLSLSKQVPLFHVEFQ